MKYSADACGMQKMSPGKFVVVLPVHCWICICHVEDYGMLADLITRQTKLLFNYVRYPLH